MEYTDDPDVSVFEPRFDSLIRKEGIDLSSPKANFVRAIYGQESGSGANTKTSNRGAGGGMQVRPDTFKQVYPDGDPKNADHQLVAGIRYASQGYDAAKGDPKLAATYYYGGPGGMAQAQKGIAVSDPVNPKNPNTLQYADQVVARMPKLAAMTMRMTQMLPLLAEKPQRHKPLAACQIFCVSLCKREWLNKKAQNKLLVKVSKKLAKKLLECWTFYMAALFRLLLELWRKLLLMPLAV